MSIESWESLDSFREEWSALASESDNIFWTWEWQSLWWRHFGRGRPLMLRALRDEERRLIAIYPWYLARRSPLRLARFLGHGHGDWFGPICRSADREAAARGLPRALESIGCDVFLGDHVPAQAAWADDLDAKVLRRMGYPVLRLATTSWEEFLASRSSNFRQNIRRFQRKYGNQHDVRFRRCTDPSRLHADLDTAFQLHKMSLAGHRECGYCGSSERFQREFAELAMARGWLRLRIMEIDGVPVGALHHYRFNGIEFAYQGGRDPSWNHASVGFAIEVEAVRSCVEDGAREYRFLDGNEDYKYRFATEDPGLETVLAARSGVGRLALAALSGLGSQPFIASLGKRIAG
jgi:CelD/BcsL family acetyltransferase involved in cellulose biosynthesis